MSKINLKQLKNNKSNDNSLKNAEFNDFKKTVNAENQNQTHNVKKEVLGPNTKR